MLGLILGEMLGDKDGDSEGEIDGIIKSIDHKSASKINPLPLYATPLSEYFILLSLYMIAIN